MVAMDAFVFAVDTRTGYVHTARRIGRAEGYAYIGRYTDGWAWLESPWAAIALDTARTIRVRAFDKLTLPL